MKALYFHQHFSTPAGSTAIRSYEMALHLVENGHEVTMVCGSYGGSDTGLSDKFVRGRRQGIVDEIEVIEFDLSYSNSDGFTQRSITFLRFALLSIRVALTKKYDIVFATSTPLTAGIPGIIARHIRRKPFIFEVRDLWPELPKAMGVITNPVILWAMSVLEWVSYRSATRLIGLSPGIVEGIKARGVATGKIAMIPNGCDLRLFREQQPLWRPAEVGGDDLMVVFAGTHGAANGLDAVLDAAGVLKSRERSDIKLVLIGAGALKDELQQRVATEGLDNVIFHDPVDKRKLIGLLNEN